MFLLALLLLFAFAFALVLGLTVSAVSSPFAGLVSSTSDLSSSWVSFTSVFALVLLVLLAVLVFFALAFTLALATALSRGLAFALALAFKPLELEASAAAGRRRGVLPLVEGAAAAEASGVVDFGWAGLGDFSFFTSFAFLLGSCQNH